MCLGICIIIMDCVCEIGSVACLQVCDGIALMSQIGNLYALVFIYLLSLSKWWWRTPCDRYCKTSSMVDWRWRAPGKPDSNEEKNCNPMPETVYNILVLPVILENWQFLYLAWLQCWLLTSLCPFVSLCLLRLHYAPLQWYMGYLCTIRAQYAPPRRIMHHGAQGRLYFLKNSGDPDDFLFWWLTENTHKICLSGKCTYMYLNGSHGWFIGSQVFEWVTLLQLFLGSQVFFIRAKGALIPLRVAHKEHTSV